jgi:hypothetical protein
METIEQKLRKNGITNGLLLGIIIFVSGIISFYFITAMTNNMIMLVLGPILFSTLVPLIFAVVFCFDLRKKIGGFWSYRQATTGIFIMFLCAYLLSYAGNLVFSKVIEPDMVEKMKTVFVTTTTNVLEKQKVDQETIDKKVSDIESNFDSQKKMTAVTVVKSLGIAIIMDFVLALIFAAFFKREPLLQAEDHNYTTDPAV